MKPFLWCCIYSLSLPLYLPVVRPGFRPELPVPVAHRQRVDRGSRPRRLPASPWRRAGGRGAEEAEGETEWEIKERELSFLLLWQAVGRWSHSTSGNQEGTMTPFYFRQLLDFQNVQKTFSRTISTWLVLFFSGGQTLPGHHQTAAVSALHRETTLNTSTYIEASIHLLLTPPGCCRHIRQLNPAENIFNDWYWSSYWSYIYTGHTVH